MSLEKRNLVECEIKRLHTMTGIALLTLAIFAGVSRRTFREWHKRNSSQFISKDFRELTKLLEIEHTFTSPGHPQSNGKLERFHRTLKSEHVRTSSYFSYEDAKERMGSWIEYYNNERLHSAHCYLPPEDVFQGLKEIRLAERRKKMYHGLINRRSYWQSLNVGSKPPYKLTSKTASSA